MPLKDELIKGIEALELTPSRWQFHNKRLVELEGCHGSGVLGLKLQYRSLHGQCEVTGLEPSLPHFHQLNRANVIGWFLLEINGIDVHLYDDVIHALDTFLARAR